MSVKSTLARGLTAAAVLAATAASALVPASSASTSAAARVSQSVGPQPTIVLVHGAFADASSWNDEIAELLCRGYPVIAPPNPLRGAASDAAAVRSLVRSVNGPVVLVAHSYGGQVITNAARNEPNVKALVYIAAFIPDEGETVLDLSNKYPGSTLGQTLQPVPLSDGSADLYVKQDLFWKQFAADVPLAKARLMAATQRPISDAALKEPSGAPAWRDIPSWSLIPTGDKNTPPAAHRFMSKRAHAHTVEIKGASHAVLVSHPHAVTKLIIAAANAS